MTCGAQLIFSQVFGPANQIPKDLGCQSDDSSKFLSLRSSTLKMKESFERIALGVKIESSDSDSVISEAPKAVAHPGSSMRLRRRDVKREDKSKKLLKLKVEPVPEPRKAVHEPELVAERSRRGRKPKRLLSAVKEHENSKLSGAEFDLLCTEKPMTLGLIVKDESQQAEVVQINNEQDRRPKQRKTKRTEAEPAAQPVITNAPFVAASLPLPTRAIDPVADDMKPCTCKNGKCAKKYCVCLKRAAKCNPMTCTCRDCANLDSAEAETRRSEQLKKLEEGQLVRKGCNCKRNRCEQNYCVCFQQGLGCDANLCDCSDCKNVGHFQPDEGSELLQKVKTAN